MVRRSRMGKSKQPNVGPTEKGLNPNLVTDGELGPTGSGSALNTTKKLLEVVEWRDAYFDTDDEGHRPDYIVATVGWTEEEDSWLKITSELTPDGERAVTRVPLINVVRRRHLVIVNSPSTWTTSPSPTDLTC